MFYCIIIVYMFIYNINITIILLSIIRINEMFNQDWN
jgi:hypothetical protein